jgi:hypothetical protein
VKTWRLLFLLSLASAIAGFGSDRPTLSCKVSVPPEARGADISPNGETNAVRYTAAYEAFWWNCVLVRAEALEARCPFMCSGDAAATLGCADGGAKASNDIDGLVRRFSRKQTREYLRTLAQDPAGRLRVKPYFGNGPRSETVPK